MAKEVQYEVLVAAVTGNVNSPIVVPGKRDAYYKGERATAEQLAGPDPERQKAVIDRLKRKKAIRPVVVENEGADEEVYDPEVHAAEAAAAADLAHAELLEKPMRDLVAEVKERGGRVKVGVTKSALAEYLLALRNGAPVGGEEADKTDDEKGEGGNAGAPAA